MNKPKIEGAVRYGGTVYKTGDEEALEKALRKADDRKAAEHLIKKGVISGVITEGEESSEPKAAETPQKSGAEPKEPATGGKEK
jgi:hypothetical protein